MTISRLGIILGIFYFLYLGLSAQAAAIPKGAKPWPNAIVTYCIDPIILSRARAKGRDCTGWAKWPKLSQAYRTCQAMDEWHRKTGIDFVSDAKNSPRALIIEDSKTGTTATVGYGLINRVHIEKGASYGSILHEFGHVLGLMHEHQRPDRHNYISFAEFLENYMKTCGIVTVVCRDVRNAFPVVNTQMQSDYDPCSLMHYLQNQGPRHREDPRWQRIFDLTSKGKSQLKACLPQFANLPSRCQKIGQKCAISRQDAAIVRRFHGLKAYGCVALDYLIM